MGGVRPTGAVKRIGLATFVWAASLLCARPALAQATDPAEGALVLVLAPVGADRDGLPVYTRHPKSAEYVALLTRGFSGRLLRLYRWEQQLRARRDGTSIEPAYLLLSRNEGGFPRTGFWLDAVRKDGVGYVDLHEGLTRSGRFGAIDQIFPHELMHVILHQLAGSQPPGTAGANQVHAIGVRTDRVTAFDEGLAEHAQVMAIDDPDALPDTSALSQNTSAAIIADARLQSYRRALDARWSLAPPSRLSFLLWYSQTEQVLRYHAVKANLFARTATLSPRLLARDDLYAAYLIESVMPGEPDASFKSTPRLLATEGAISSLFARWVTTPALQQPVTADPLEQAYVKLFTVFADYRPHDLPAFVRGYTSAFPTEAGAVEDLLRRAGFKVPLVATPEIWLASDRFTTGTTVFDQYRALPRVHTFDLNAASTVDLLTVEGITPALASAIQQGAPYSTLTEVNRVSGMTPAVAARLRGMRDGMDALRAANTRTSLESLRFTRLLRPMFVRAAGWITACAFLAGWLYGRVRPLPAWRLGLNGLAAAVFSLLPAWILGVSFQVGDRLVDPALLACLPVFVCGVPGALWSLIRQRALPPSFRTIAAWTVASVPGVLVVVSML
jgi:hypothetical protein